MPTLKRYIISSRTAGPLSQGASARLHSMVNAPGPTAEIRQTPAGRRVVQIEESNAADLVRNHPDAIVEEDVPLRMLAGMPGLPNVVPTDTPYLYPVRVRQAGTGKPLANVTIYGLGQSITYKADNDTDANGQTVLRAGEPRLKMLLASPRDGNWSRFLPNVDSVDAGGTPFEIELLPLPITGDYEWGHKLMGFPQVNQVWTGAGVKIGLIDSGISATHEDIRPAGGINTLSGEDPTAWSNDLEGHGTHCTGIIAAQVNSVGVIGGAPNAQVFAVRVFPGGFVSDLVQAVEWCIQNKMDVISMSLGMSDYKESLAQVLQEASARGITCIAATGNEAGAVAYPAAYPNVIAVGALGASGTFPQDSGHALKVGSPSPYAPGVFAAAFSNFGPQVAVCAPGLAILSSVPTGYAAWDGTSMACPMVTALVALILEGYPSIRTNDFRQSQFVRAILDFSCVDLGLPAALQGRGFPFAPKALATAVAAQRAA